MIGLFNVNVALLFVLTKLPTHAKALMNCVSSLQKSCCPCDIPNSTLRWLFCFRIDYHYTQDNTALTLWRFGMDILGAEPCAVLLLVRVRGLWLVPLSFPSLSDSCLPPTPSVRIELATVSLRGKYGTLNAS